MTKNKYPKIAEDKLARFNFITEAKVLYRFKVEAAKRGMSTGKLIGLLIKSYVNSLED